MAEKPSRTPGRTSRTILLSTELIERARNAVFWTRVMPGEPASFAALAERALGKEVDRLERAYNEGQPFPHGDLRPGPAPGVMQRVIAERKARMAAEGEGQGGGRPGELAPSSSTHSDGEAAVQAEPETVRSPEIWAAKEGATEAEGAPDRGAGMG